MPDHAGTQGVLDWKVARAGLETPPKQIPTRLESPACGQMDVPDHVLWARAGRIGCQVTPAAYQLP